MAFLKLEVEIEGVERAEKLLHGIDGAKDQAVRRAFNRGTKKARTEAKREATKRYAITQGNIMKYSKVTLTPSDGSTAKIEFSGQKIPLYRFTTRPKNRTYTGEKIVLMFRDGQTHAVFKNKPVSAMDAKATGFREEKNSFIATMQTGHTGLFKRLGQDRYPIKEEWGFALADMLDYEPARESIMEKTAEEVNKQLEHEIGRILGRY